jgi:type III secretion system needle length determinant
MKTGSWQGSGPGLDQQASGQDPARQQQPAPDAEQADRFAALMGEKAARAEAPPRPARVVEKGESLPVASSPGDAILRGLMGGGPAAALPEPPPGAGRLLQEIASRILVSDPSGGAPREIRIAVKEDVFPGLEIRIAEADGRLRIQLVALPGADVALLQGQIASLAEHLGRRLKRELEVELLIEQDEDTPDADADAGGIGPPWPSGPLRP